MIVIDKSLSENNIIVTVTELTTVESPVYTMVVHSDYTKITYTMPLGTNVSDSIGRYDKFIIADEHYNGIQPGKCTYAIYQTTDTSLTPVEIGFILFKDNVPSTEYVCVEEPDNADDYIVFNG